jgi:hypothetical protein
MAATDAQRAAVAGRRCIVCGTEKRIDPAHLLSARRRDGTSVVAARSLVDMSAKGEGSQRVLAEPSRRRREKQQRSAGCRPEELSASARWLLLLLQEQERCQHCCVSI